MARHCQCCVSKSHRAIDRALLSGQTIASVSRRFGVSWDSVQRHLKGHITKVLQKHALLERESVRRGGRLQEMLDYIARKAQDILEQAEAGGNLSIALHAVRELRESCKLAAIAAGELNEGAGTQVNIQINHQAPDEVRDARAYLDACNVPTELIEQVMTYISSKYQVVLRGTAL